MHPIILTDSQWALVAPVVEEHLRPRKHSTRSIIEAIFYVLRTGCQWRLLPGTFPPHETVYYHFRRLGGSNFWARLNRTLVLRARRLAGKKPPRAAALDSQSVKHLQGTSDIGTDMHKRVRGRKRHLAVDMMGNVLAATAGAASEHDGREAGPLLDKAAHAWPSLRLVVADEAYGGPLGREAAWAAGLDLVRVEKPRGKGFIVLPGRWVVERSISWLSWSRRLSKDYEKQSVTSVWWVLLANIHRILCNWEKYRTAN
jgi:putative transposase